MLVLNLKHTVSALLGGLFLALGMFSFGEALLFDHLVLPFFS